MRFFVILWLASVPAGLALVWPKSQTRRLGRPTSLAAAKVFIDGEAGTTGLQVRERLAKRTDLELLTLPDDKRKDAQARSDALNEADAVILCLPDAAAVEAVALLDKTGNTKTVVIDASTAHRTNPDWVYGFPELDSDQASKIKASTRIANPGCYPTGFVALTRPLVDAKLLRDDAKLSVSAVSGYSGGGKALMEIYEGPADSHEPWGQYGFTMEHKHLPEMKEFSRLQAAPVFLPAVGSFAQGMVVSVPVHFDGHLTRKGRKQGGAGLHTALTEHYAGSAFVEVMPLGANGATDAGLLERGAFLRPDALNDSNRLQLFVFNNDEVGTAVLVARLDNLGKGASGAAVQNLNLALGLGEATGL